MRNPSNENIFPRCVLCHQVPSGGLHDGIRVMKQFVCTNCEHELIHLSEDDPRYHAFVGLMTGAFASTIGQIR